MDNDIENSVRSDASSKATVTTMKSQSSVQCRSPLMKRDHNIIQPLMPSSKVKRNTNYLKLKIDVPKTKLDSTKEISTSSGGVVDSQSTTRCSRLKYDKMLKTNYITSY
jgi:hypothetical protein